MFHTFLVDPIYNVFVFILSHIPGGDAGLAIILLTLLVRVVFYPLFASSIRTQMALQAVQPELSGISDRYKDDPMERSRRTAELFSRHRIRPFSLIFSTLLQVVIFIALSYVFFRLAPPEIHTDLLYSFVPAPAQVSENFFGLLDLTATHNILLTIIATILQYVAIRLSLMRTKVDAAHETPQKQQMQRLQKNMMQYMFPAMMAVAVFTFPGAMGLYIAINSAVSIVQEMVLRRRPL